MTTRTVERSGAALPTAREAGDRGHARPEMRNVGDAERALTGVLAGALLLKAVARPSAWSIPLGPGSR